MHTPDLLLCAECCRQSVVRLLVQWSLVRNATWSLWDDFVRQAYITLWNILLRIAILGSQILESWDSGYFCQSQIPELAAF